MPTQGHKIIQSLFSKHCWIMYHTKQIIILAVSYAVLSEAWVSPTKANAAYSQLDTSVKFFGSGKKQTAGDKDVTKKAKSPPKTKKSAPAKKEIDRKNPKYVMMFGKPEWDWTKNKPVTEESWQKKKRVDWLNR